MTIPAIPTNLTERLNALEEATLAEEDEASPTPAPRFTGARDIPAFVQLLTCALRERHIDLLERCLKSCSEPVVRESTRQLQHVDAGALLVYLVDKVNYLGSPPLRYHIWIRFTLLHHAVYLSQAPGIQKSLKVLGSVLREAQALRRPLTGLVGRAAVIAANASRGQEVPDARLKGLADVAAAPGVLALPDLTVGEELGSEEDTDGSAEDTSDDGDVDDMTDDSSDAE